MVSTNKYHSGNKVDGKHYWLTPPELMEQLKSEFSPDLFDPCPFPRPEGFNGLTCDWKKTNYINMPFGTVIENGKRIGTTAWVRKAIAEQARGNTSIIVWPMHGWVHRLLAAGAEIRTLGEVKWLATEDGTSQKGSSREIVMFVLRGAEVVDAEAPPQKGEAAVNASHRESAAETEEHRSDPLGSSGPENRKPFSRVAKSPIGEGDQYDEGAA